jgi:hypothetical protein
MQGLFKLTKHDFRPAERYEDRGLPINLVVPGQPLLLEIRILQKHGRILPILGFLESPRPLNHIPMVILLPGAVQLDGFEDLGWELTSLLKGFF